MAHFDEIEAGSALETGTATYLGALGCMAIARSEAAAEFTTRAIPAAVRVVSGHTTVAVWDLEALLVGCFFPGEGQNLCLKNQMLSLDFFSRAMDLLMETGFFAQERAYSSLYAWAGGISQFILEGGHRERFELLSARAESIYTFPTPSLGLMGSLSFDEQQALNIAWNNLSLKQFRGADVALAQRQAFLLKLMGARLGADAQHSYATVLKTIVSFATKHVMLAGSTSVEFTTGGIATLLARIGLEPWDVNVLASLGAPILLQLKLALTDISLAPRANQELFPFVLPYYPILNLITGKAKGEPTAVMMALQNTFNLKGDPLAPFTIQQVEYKLQTLQEQDVQKVALSQDPVGALSEIMNSRKEESKFYSKSGSFLALSASPEQVRVFEKTYEGVLSAAQQVQTSLGDAAMMHALLSGNAGSPVPLPFFRMMGARDAPRLPKGPLHSLGTACYLNSQLHFSRRLAMITGHLPAHMMNFRIKKTILASFLGGNLTIEQLKELATAYLQASAGDPNQEVPTVDVCTVRGISLVFDTLASLLSSAGFVDIEGENSLNSVVKKLTEWASQIDVLPSRAPSLIQDLVSWIIRSVNDMIAKVKVSSLGDPGPTGFLMSETGVLEQYQLLLSGLEAVRATQVWEDFGRGPSVVPKAEVQGPPQKKAKTTTASVPYSQRMVKSGDHLQIGNVRMSLTKFQDACGKKVCPYVGFSTSCDHRYCPNPKEVGHKSGTDFAHNIKNFPRNWFSPRDPDKAACLVRDPN